MFEVRIARQNVLEVEFLHHDHGREVGEGDVGLIVVLPTKVHGSSEAVSHNPLDPKETSFSGADNALILLKRLAIRKTEKKLRIVSSST